MYEIPKDVSAAILLQMMSTRLWTPSSLAGRIPASTEVAALPMERITGVIVLDSTLVSCLCLASPLLTIHFHWKYGDRKELNPFMDPRWQESSKDFPVLTRFQCLTGLFCHLTWCDVCGENGFCNLTRCDCYPGFTGQRCQDSLTPCLPNPCGENGHCSPQNESYTCRCTLDFEGKRNIRIHSLPEQFKLIVWLKQMKSCINIFEIRLKLCSLRTIWVWSLFLKFKLPF